MPSPEHTPNPDHAPEKLKDIERAPELLDSAERTPEESPEEVEKHVEKARNEAEQEAISGREVSKGEKKTHGDESTPPPHRSRKESYNHTMKSVRAELSAPERVFSKFIHAPAIERASDAIGKTIARPDAILSGSVFACIFVLAVYILAKFYGFELRGSETILAFIVGWAIGIVFDIIRGIIKRKRS
jgi:small-conductance mechanosensitive channel